MPKIPKNWFQSILSQLEVLLNGGRTRSLSSDCEGTEYDIILLSEPNHSKSLKIKSLYKCWHLMNYFWSYWALYFSKNDPFLKLAWEGPLNDPIFFWKFFIFLDKKRIWTTIGLQNALRIDFSDFNFWLTFRENAWYIYT